MSDRKRRLSSLDTFRRRLPHVSQSALSAVLDEVEKIGVPQTHGRNAMREAREIKSATETPYGPLHQELELTSDDGAIPLRFVHPLAFLWLAYNTCKPFADFLFERCQSNPSSPDKPWDLALYSDEVTPGDANSIDARRKMQVVYYSFLQFGSAALCREDLWFQITSKRSSEVNKCHGGMSQLFGALVKVFFVSAVGDIRTCGIRLMREGPFVPVDIFCKLSCFVQDGAAHKMTFHHKGDAGAKHCLLCKNVFSSTSSIADEDGTHPLCSNVIKYNMLDLASSAELRRAALKIRDHKAIDPPGIFKLRQMALGFTDVPYSMLTDPALDDIVFPSDQLMHDYMHGVFVGGCWSVVMNLFLEALRLDGVADVYEMFYDYIALWTPPMRVKAARAQDVFLPRRRKGNVKAGHFKCQASEALSTYALVAQLIQRTFLPAGVCVPECMAYIALTDCIDCFVSANRGLGSPAELLSAIERFLQLFDAAFGVDYMTPKFHWLLHYADHFSQFGLLVSCFVHERKHKQLKRYANDMRNTCSFERSILHDCTCSHLSSLENGQSLHFEVGLIKPRKASKKVRDFLCEQLGIDERHVFEMSSDCRYSPGGVSCVKDVVLVTSSDGINVQAGQVWAHAAINGEPLSVVTLWECHGKNKAMGCADWVCSDDAHVVPASDIVDVLTWSRVSAEIIRTLLPRYLV